MICLCAFDVQGVGEKLDKKFNAYYSVFMSKGRIIDGIDKQMLDLIQQDARISNAEIARQVGLAPSAVLERFRKLEDSGIIQGYSARIDPVSVDFGLLAFVFVRTTDCGTEIDQQMAAIPEVLEIHDVAGEDSYLLKVRSASTEELAKLLREKLKPLPGVVATRTTVVLQTVKETSALPLSRCGEDRKTKTRSSAQ
jgi:Lrp/AsnC family transcriptional regulator, leucine-responsive regulatory protein